MNFKQALIPAFLLLFLFSCKKKEIDSEFTEQTEPKLIFRFKFDSTQARLNSTGGIAVLPTSHKAQSPRMNKVGVNYIELVKDDITPIAKGHVLYQTPEIISSGISSIDFNQLLRVGDDQIFFSVPLSKIEPGVFKWLRISIAYQNFTVSFQDTSISGSNLLATIASFIGHSTYIGNYTINKSTVAVNDVKSQGYWGFETLYNGIANTKTGQASKTTVVNSNYQNTPNPSGSSVFTSKFVKPGGLPSQLIINGDEKQDVIITVSLSVNNSFEWIETNGNSSFNPNQGDVIYDTGIRGIVPFWY